MMVFIERKIRNYIKQIDYVVVVKSHQFFLSLNIIYFVTIYNYLKLYFKSQWDFNNTNAVNLKEQELNPYIL